MGKKFNTKIIHNRKLYIIIIIKINEYIYDGT